LVKELSLEDFRDVWLIGFGVTPTVCMCCGEAISSRGRALSRNPNLCASCSSLLDGIEETPPLVEEAGGQPLRQGEQLASGGALAEWVSGGATAGGKKR
jgi:hypothetical protein